MSTASTLGEDLELTATRPAGTAKALLWWSTVPPLPGERLGVVGGFSATSEEAATSVLRQAGEVLRSKGCTLAVGPMDGNTWRKYRFVTDPGKEPAFFLEPANPPEWPGWWRSAGFVSLAEYYSSATTGMTARDDRLAGVAARMNNSGVTIRAFDPTRFEAELQRIYDVSVVSFRSNFLYTPLPQESFVGQYRMIQSQLRPEFVLLAERDGHPVGYVFAVPDFAQAQRGEPVNTIIVKTLAVLPGRDYAGLGALLLDETHRRADEHGFRRAIHALMHETNKSRNLSAHYAQTIRRYTLFSARLSA